MIIAVIGAILAILSGLYNLMHADQAYFQYVQTENIVAAWLLVGYLVSGLIILGVSFGGDGLGGLSEDQLSNPNRELRSTMYSILVWRGSLLLGPILFVFGLHGIAALVWGISILIDRMIKFNLPVWTVVGLFTPDE